MASNARTPGAKCHLSKSKKALLSVESEMTATTCSKKVAAKAKPGTAEQNNAESKLTENLSPGQNACCGRRDHRVLVCDLQSGRKLSQSLYHIFRWHQGLGEVLIAPNKWNAGMPGLAQCSGTTPQINIGTRSQRVEQSALWTSGTVLCYRVGRSIAASRQRNTFLIVSVEARNVGVWERFRHTKDP